MLKIKREKTVPANYVSQSSSFYKEAIRINQEVHFFRTRDHKQVFSVSTAGGKV